MIPASGTSLSAVIFDFWDTLVPFPLDIWNQMTEELAARLGVSLSRLTPIWDDEAHPRMIGAIDACLARVARALDVAPDEAFIAQSSRGAWHSTAPASIDRARRRTNTGGTPPARVQDRRH